MTKSKFELIDIAKMGASLVVDGSKYSKFELIDIVKVIVDGCTLEVTNSDSKSKFELMDIAKSTKVGKIIFS